MPTTELEEMDFERHLQAAMNEKDELVAPRSTRDTLDLLEREAVFNNIARVVRQIKKSPDRRVEALREDSFRGR